MEELELWREYKEFYNLEARDALIEKYLNYAYSIGVKVHRRYSDFLNIDKEELFGITSFALIKAIDNFDLSRSTSFMGFLSKVLPWYIKNELSKYMNISIKNQAKILKKLSSRSGKDLVSIMISLSYRNIKMLGNDSGNFMIKDDSTSEKIEKNEIMELISFAINNLLDDKERIVLRCIYFDNKKTASISNDLKLTIQRINQIHKAALNKIRDFLERSYRR